LIVKDPLPSFAIFPITEICRAIFKTRTLACHYYINRSTQSNFLTKLRHFSYKSDAVKPNMLEGWEA